MNAPQPPKPRRRIAGEAKPGETGAPQAPAPEPTSAETPKPAKPKLPKRPKTPRAEEPQAPAQPDLPAAPPRPEAVRVPRAKPSATFVVLLVAAVAAASFAGFGIWRGVDQWRDDNIAASREQAADAAASAAETIFSYHYSKLDAHVREAQKTMTPSFAKKFKSISPALNALAPQRKIQVKAVVRNAATVECGDKCRSDRATVLIFIDQARVTAEADRPTVFGNRIQLSMARYDGKWLVSNVKAL